MELYPTVQNRLPPRAQVHDLVTRDGIHLRGFHAVPDNPKGTVVILGGRAEFVERYFETASDLLKRGYAVASFDWRGQGGSQRLLTNPLRGHVRSFADYDLDLDTVMARLVLPYCPKPFFALGHSTGGHILLRALRETKWFSRAMITAPLLGLNFGLWPKFVARSLTLLAKLTYLDWVYLPGFRHLPFTLEQFDGNPLTSDKKRFRRDVTTLNEHPQLRVGGPTFGWLRATLKSLDELKRWPRNKGPSCPTMIIAAGEDRVVNNKGTQAFIAQVPGISFLTLAGSRHEILNERDEIREKFLAAFEAFIAS
jgi:lysophospholipase